MGFREILVMHVYTVIFECPPGNSPHMYMYKSLTDKICSFEILHFVPTTCRYHHAFFPGLYTVHQYCCFSKTTDMAERNGRNNQCKTNNVEGKMYGVTKKSLLCKSGADFTKLLFCDDHYTVR